MATLECVASEATRGQADGGTSPSFHQVLHSKKLDLDRWTSEVAFETIPLSMKALQEVRHWPVDGLMVGKAASKPSLGRLRLSNKSGLDRWMAIW
jgi:hypothetical protein